VKGTLCKKTQLIQGAFVAFGPFWHALFPGFRGENGAVAAIVWHLESAKPVAIFLLSRSAAFGKTTIVKAILRILAAKNTGLLLCALMGV
jgi:hypothetical protein